MNRESNSYQWILSSRMIDIHLFLGHFGFLCLSLKVKILSIFPNYPLMLSPHLHSWMYHNQRNYYLTPDLARFHLNDANYS